MFKKKKTKKWEKLNDFGGALQELLTENDRSIVIIAGAYLDVQLEQVISNFLLDSPALVAELLEPDHPVGSFGARIKMAYCLGLVEDWMYHDLKVIQKIRNAFAHELHGLSFKDEHVVGWCNSLTLTPLAKERSLELRDLFFFSFVMLSEGLNRAAIVAKREQRTERRGLMAIDEHDQAQR